jgi:hypothetical protein
MEKRQKMIWTNVTKSGLCDRLQDLFLVAAYANMINCDLYLYWPEGQKDLQFNDFQLKTWPKSRWSDYLKNNLCSYFNLPNNVYFLNDNDSNKEGYYFYFNDYLGGIFNRKTFSEKYNLNKLEFYKFHDECLSQFTPKDKLVSLFNTSDNIDLAIHLRRTDKVNSLPNFFLEIHSSELQNLNDKTIQCILNEVQNNKEKKINVYICSDCEDTKKYFNETISNVCNIIETPQINFDYEQTYIDLYYLSNSKKLIMSQKHSNFSYFSSSIKKNLLIYFYKENELISNSDTNNYIFFEDSVK